MRSLDRGAVSFEAASRPRTMGRRRVAANDAYASMTIFGAARPAPAGPSSCSFTARAMAR